MCRSYLVLSPSPKKSQLFALPKVFHIDLPEALSEALDQCADDKAAREVGIEWSKNQCKELMNAGVPVLHFYTMGLSGSNP